jgi:Ran-binding protein 1
VEKETAATQLSIESRANSAVSADMKLSPNVGSDRSWVWNVLADYAEGEPTAETLAIRFGNSESESTRS